MTLTLRSAPARAELHPATQQNPDLAPPRCGYSPRESAGHPAEGPPDGIGEPHANFSAFPPERTPCCHSPARPAQTRLDFRVHSRRQPDIASSLLIPRLLQDTVQRLRVQFIAWMTRDRNQPRLGRVFILPMTPALPGKVPTILLQLAQKITDFRCPLSPRSPHRHPIQLHRRHAHAHRHALPVFAAGADPFIERQIVAHH